MRNADLLSPSPARNYGGYDPLGSKSLSSFIRNGNSVLAALRKGNVELSSFAENAWHRLRPKERVEAFEIIRDTSFVKKHSKDYRLLKARFNPKNQYRVKTFYMGKENVYECFMFEGKFHTGAQLFLNENYITEVVQIAQDRVKSIHIRR